MCKEFAPSDFSYLYVPLRDIMEGILGEAADEHKKKAEKKGETIEKKSIPAPSLENMSFCTSVVCRSYC